MPGKEAVHSEQSCLFTKVINPQIAIERHKLGEDLESFPSEGGHSKFWKDLV